MIRLFDWTDEKGPSFGASTTNGDENTVDCHCFGDPTYADNWDVSICKMKNSDLDEENLKNILAQLFMINMGGPFKTYLLDESWAGGFFVVAQRPQSVEDFNYNHSDTNGMVERYLTGDCGHEFMGDM